jgi:hypothetical protein
MYYPITLLVLRYILRSKSLHVEEKSNKNVNTDNENWTHSPSKLHA